MATGTHQELTLLSSTQLLALVHLILSIWLGHHFP